MRARARHYRTGELVDVVWSSASIEAVTPPTGGAADLEADWIAPGLFDLQINGCMGKGFTSATLGVADVRLVAEVCHRHGITGFLPTLITSSRETLANSFRVLASARAADPHLARVIPGYHLEGPWISAEDGPRGAHAREHVRPPSWEEFRLLQDAAEGGIRLVTLAPEHAEALPFIEKLVGEGLVVALGHTAATPARIRDAVAAGARLSTHLGNGCHALLPRHESYLWEQLADDRLIASIISDGHHLPSALVRCFLRVKTPARLVLTCDASSLAGLPPGRYHEWGQDLEVLPGGKVVVLGTPFLAGSGVFTDRCVAEVLRLGEVPLADAIDMAGANPRRLLGLAPVGLEPGSPAELALFAGAPEQGIRLTASVVAGRVFQQVP